MALKLTFVQGDNQAKDIMFFSSANQLDKKALIAVIILQANCVQYRIIIRDVKTLQIRSLFTCLDSVDVVEVCFISYFSSLFV